MTKLKKRKSNAKPKATPAFFVGIGASAGGLEALRLLFGELGTLEKMTFVVVQHLAPQHQSRLVELIGHSTKLPVEEVRDGQVPEPGRVYITPPNKDVFLRKGRLGLKTPHFKVGPKPSIDLFFQSLAEDAKERAIGIILSGTGSDGALGVRAIKAEGGLSICQKLETAKYDGMPKAAKLTGLVDLELAPEEIAQELTEMDRTGGRLRHQDPVHQKPSRTLLRPGDDPYLEVLEILEQEIGANFSQYKPTTIRRRMERRVVATRSGSLAGYAEYLRETSDEAKLLFQDILISVTSFLRDSDAWSALNRVILDRLKAKPAGGVFRVWVVGCATGEEAYTIAILLNEAAGRLKKPVQTQIFATDIDEHALAIARKGLYSPAAIREFPKSLRERYFTPVEDCFQVKPSIRDRVVFARQNVATDPPFLNLDLVTCRNVLIYFNSKLQEKVFQTLHYALSHKGVLFLGRSETVPTPLGYFDLMDKGSKIFTRVDRKGEVPRALPKRELTREAALISKEKGSEPSEAGDLFGSLVETAFSHSVLVDEEFKVKHFFGNVGAYLTYPAGQATHSILKIVPPDRSIELSALLRRAQKSGQPASGRKFEAAKGDRSKLFQQQVLPLSAGGRRQYLVAFQPVLPLASLALSDGERSPPKSDEKSGGAAAAERIRELEQELSATKDHLQTVIEEQETSNEELQALNEEMQSTNEELQSSNEELETTNEELQSTNEELTTLNQELNVKSGELQAINQRLQAVQSAIAYPLMILDQKRQILGFNAAAKALLRVTEQDLRTHVRALTYPVDLDPVFQRIDQAMEKKADAQLQFRTKDRAFEVQVQLLRGHKDVVEGAVVSFVDNTEIAHALENNKVMRDRLSMIFENVPGFVKTKDLSGVYTFVNHRFCEFVGRKAEEILGRTDEEIFGPESGKPLRAHDLEVIRTESPQEFLEEFWVGGERKIWMASKFPLFDSRQRVQSTCAVAFDITKRVLHERQLDLFKKAISASASGILILEESEDGYRSTFASDQVGGTLRVSPGDLLGLTIEELLTKLRLEVAPGLARTIASEMTRESTTTHLLPIKASDNEREESKKAWVELKSCKVSLSDTRQGHLILTLFEATPQVEAQQMISSQQDELAKFNRLSALGEISAGIAHEINTPLNVITTKTDLLRTAVTRAKLDDRIALKISSDIDQMVKNISGIVMGLKSIAGLDPERFERASFTQIVHDTVKICEFRLHRYGIELRLDLPAQEEVILFCCRVQIIQILINLLNNSIEAICEDRAKRWISIAVRRDASHVTLSVTDSGLGIEPSVAERIMTPFFTTKKAQKGTGIGLSLSRAIARHHGGDLVLDSDGPNTTFKLVLPLKRRPAGTEDALCLEGQQGEE